MLCLSTLVMKSFFLEFSYALILRLRPSFLALLPKFVSLSLSLPKEYINRSYHHGLELKTQEKNIYLCTCVKYAVGYKGKDDPNNKNGSERKRLEEERKKRRDEYRQNSGIIKLQDKLQSEKKVYYFHYSLSTNIASHL